MVHDGYEGLRGPAALEQRGLAAYGQPCGASSEYDLSQVLGRSVGQHTGQRAENHLVSCAFECFRINMDSVCIKPFPLQLLIVVNHVLRSLDQLNQNSLSAQRVGLLALRMDEGHIVTSSTLTNTTRGETHALLLEVLHAGRQIINPQTNVVQWGNVHLGALGRIIRLHDVDLHGHGSLSAAQDILLHVLLGGLAIIARKNTHLERVDLIETEDVNPQVLEGSLAGSTNSNLLNTQNSVGLSGGEGTSLKHQSPSTETYSEVSEHFKQLNMRCKWENWGNQRTQRNAQPLFKTFLTK